MVAHEGRKRLDIFCVAHTYHGLLFSSDLTMPLHANFNFVLVSILTAEEEVPRHTTGVPDMFCFSVT